MIIKKISIENFRCLKNESLEFSKDFNVLVGINGSGKTTILEAISISLGGILSGLDGVRSREILADDVRLEHFNLGSVIDTQPQFPVRVTCSGFFNNKLISWTRALNIEGGRTTRNEAKSITNYANKLQKEVRMGDENVILPVISYYGTGRLWVQKRQKKQEVLAKLQSRFLGYADCLDPASNEKLMTKWFEKMTLIQLQEGKEPGELRAVKNVLKQCLSKIDNEDSLTKAVDILYSVKSNDLEITFEDRDGSREKLPFRMLSDGYRNTLGLMADIAYRMAVLNPQLLDDVTKCTPGVVLIDEIDLHLHPKWQRHIVKDLKDAFPLVQFIVTTHSPNILATIKKENVIALENHKMVNQISNTYGRDINSILYDIMDVEERPEDVKYLIDKYYKLLEEEKYEIAKSKLKELSDLLGESDVEVIRAKTMYELERP